MCPATGPRKYCTDVECCGLSYGLASLRFVFGGEGGPGNSGQLTLHAPGVSPVLELREAAAPLTERASVATWNAAPCRAEGG
jgi:hypothetical protein